MAGRSGTLDETKRKQILGFARSEMDRLGLVNWKVKFVRSKSYAGLCKTLHWNSSPKMSWGTIELSEDFFEVFEEFDIVDTILHEIAHALNGPEYSANGRRALHHGPKWKEIARKIGCSGERCVRKEANRPKSKYRGVCPNGHETFMHRLTENAKYYRSCGKCSNTFSPAHMFSWYDNGQLVHARPTDKDAPFLADKIIDLLQKA